MADLLNIGLGLSPQLLNLTKQMPPCALSCVLQGIPASGCGLTNVTCMCRSQSLWDATVPCVQSGCVTRDQLTAIKIARNTCESPIRNISSQLDIVGPVLTGISLLYIVIRLFQRFRGKDGRYGLDDSLIIAAWLFGLPMTIFQILLAQDGLGQDIWEVPFNDLNETFKWLYASEPFYLFATVTTRLSVLAFFLRILPCRKFQIQVYITMAINVTFAIVVLFPLIFQCWPISYAWTRWDNQVHGHCINVNAGIWSQAAVSISLGIFLFILPLPQLYKMIGSFNLFRRLRIVSLLGMGIVVIVIAILRLRSFVSYANTTNPTYDYTYAMVMTTVEVQCGILVACIPAMITYVPDQTSTSRHRINDNNNDTEPDTKRDRFPSTTTTTLHKEAETTTTQIELGRVNGPTRTSRPSENDDHVDAESITGHEQEARCKSPI